MKDQLTGVESTVLSMSVDGLDPTYVTLSAQLPLVSVSSRTNTGVGVIIDLVVAPGARKTTIPSLVISSVLLEVDGLEHGAGVAIFVEDGLLSSFEMFTHAGEPWPISPVITSIKTGARQLDVRVI